MRWKVKPESNPQDYDMRTITKFAWLPVRTTGNVMVWLEDYRARQGFGPRTQSWLTQARITIKRIK